MPNDTLELPGEPTHTISGSAAISASSTHNLNDLFSVVASSEYYREAMIRQFAEDSWWLSSFPKSNGRRKKLKPVSAKLELYEDD